MLRTVTQRFTIYASSQSVFFIKELTQAVSQALVLPPKTIARRLVRIIDRVGRGGLATGHLVELPLPVLYSVQL